MRKDLTTERFSAAQVRSYYDRHTSGFLRFAQKGSAGTIHRAVWGPGVETRQQAFHYVEEQIAERVRLLPTPLDATHIVDLGCGVGASLCYLAERMPIRATGVTISPVQVRLARERIYDAGLSDRVECLEGDYCNLPISISPAHLAYAIESFVHGSDPALFLESCHDLIRPGGLLVICDDFRRAAAGARAARTIRRFRQGWHVNTLLDQEELCSLARAAGFEHRSTEDLSDYLELHRARDRATAALLALLRWLPLDYSRVDHLVGGNALQTCLARGWIGYDLTVFRRLP